MDKEFTKTLGKVLNRPTFLPIPAFVLDLIFSEGSKVLTDGQCIKPKRLIENGFSFNGDTLATQTSNLISCLDETLSLKKYDPKKWHRIKENAKQTPNFKTLQAKLKITYIQKGKEQTHSVSFRAKKDEILWISATFSVIRAKVTPEKVSFYNKLDKTYFEGDYTYLSDLLGTPLDFNKVQNVLFGEPLFNLKGSFETQIESLKTILSVSGEGVAGINELEFINGNIFANVWLG